MGIFVAFAGFVAVGLALSIPIPVFPWLKKRLVAKGLMHFTDPANRSTMEVKKGRKQIVVVRESGGRFANLLNFNVGRSAFFFIGNPPGFWLWVNVCGRGRDSVRAVIKIEGASIATHTLYWRPLDGAILIPKGYRGPGAFQLRDH